MADLNNVVGIFESYIGYIEKASNAQLDDFTANAGSANFTKFGRDYDKYMGTSLNGSAWCAMSTSVCFVEAFGLDAAKELLCGDLYAYTPTGAQRFKNHGQWHTGTDCQRGDVIFFKNSTRICHTGLVTGFDGSTIYTVEGNTSAGSEVIPNGGTVCAKSYSVNNSRIAGYGRPDYDSVGATSTPSEPEADRGVLQLYDRNDSAAQKWIKEVQPDGKVHLRNVATGLYFDVSGACTDNGTVIQGYTCNATDSQMFYFEPHSIGYRIVSALDGNKVVDIQGNNQTRGAVIDVWDWNGSDAQTFQVVDHGDYVEILATNGLAVEIAGGVCFGTRYAEAGTVTSTIVRTCNDHLKDLQGAISSDGIYSLDADGEYGSVTATALSKVNLSTKTCKKLIGYKYTNTTAWVQCRVGATPDGKYGSGTASKVAQYQSSKGLSADGVVGAETLKALLRDYGVGC